VHSSFVKSQMQKLQQSLFRDSRMTVVLSVCYEHTASRNYTEQDQGSDRSITQTSPPDIDISRDTERTARVPRSLCKDIRQQGSGKQGNPISPLLVNFLGELPKPHSVGLHKNILQPELPSIRAAGKRKAFSLDCSVPLLRPFAVLSSYK